MTQTIRLGLYARQCDAVFVLLALPRDWESRAIDGQVVKPAERGIKHDRAEPLWFRTADERDEWMEGGRNQEDQRRGVTCSC